MKQTLSVLVENHAGVLSRVVGLFARRAYNIESLAVGVTEDQSLSRITLVVEGSASVIEQVEKQLNKLIDVIKVRRLAAEELVTRELVLVKVSAQAGDRANIASICKIMGAKVADITVSSMTLELSDTTEHIEVFIELVRPFGLKELVRTGMVALQKGNDTIGLGKK